jgi:hypothetical protein
MLFSESPVRVPGLKAVYLKTFKVEFIPKNWYKWYLNADHHKTDKYAVT